MLILKFNTTKNDGENDLLRIRVDQLQHLEVYKHKPMKFKTKTNHKSSLESIHADMTELST